MHIYICIWKVSKIQVMCPLIALYRQFTHKSKDQTAQNQNGSEESVGWVGGSRGGGGGKEDAERIHTPSSWHLMPLKHEMTAPMLKAAHTLEFRYTPTYWNFKCLLGVIQHLDFDGHEFSWRCRRRLLSMFQGTDPWILWGPQSRSWSWLLLYFSHDERSYNICRKQWEREIHQSERRLGDTLIYATW